MTQEPGVPLDIAHYETERFQLSMSDLKQTLAKEEKLLARIPERVFVHLYLPLFAGVAEEDRIRPDVITLTNWALNVGGYFRRAEIIDQNNQVLFTVPPLADHSQVGPDGRGSNSVLQMLLNAELVGHRSPIDRDRYLSAQFGNITRDLTSVATPSSIQFAQEWNAIFKRYGYAELKLPGEVADQTATQTETAPIEVEWDDNF